MNIIAIDIGSYAIKFIVSKPDKKKWIHQSWLQVLTDPSFTIPDNFQDSFEPTEQEGQNKTGSSQAQQTASIHTNQLKGSKQDEIENHNANEKKPVMSLIDKQELLYRHQAEIIENFLAKCDFEYKLILNAPHEIFLSRFVSVPVKNIAKAKLMIPFKLEEELPFSLNDAHYSMTLRSLPELTEAFVQVSKQSDFRVFFESLRQFNINPTILTTSASCVSIVAEELLAHQHDNYCLLDIGHKTAKAWFFHQDRLVSCHTSFIAGEQINIAIAKKYKLPLSEVPVYKHQNAYVLTDDQMSQVDESQKEFAVMMNEVFSGLINDFKRWSLGHRVTVGSAVGHIYLTGGTTQLKNFKNYFQDQLDISCSSLDSQIFNSQFVNLNKVDQDPIILKRFSMANCLLYSFNYKSKIIQLLNGLFTIQGALNFPFASLGFVASRALALSLILSLFFIGERYFLNQRLELAEQKIKALIKNPNLDFNAREQRLGLSIADELLKKLQKERKYLKEEITILQSTHDINAIAPMSEVKNLLSSLPSISLMKFISKDDGSFSGIATSENLSQLEQLKSALESLRADDLFFDFNQELKQIEFSGFLIR